ncbi:MAG: alpha/beta hydrolase [Pseudomonadota bacterium]
MESREPQFIEVGEEEDAKRAIAVLETDGDGPCLMWFGGFKSDMTGTKAEMLNHWASENGLAMVRFDYSGHGRSGGRFDEGTVSRWLEEAHAVFETYCSRPSILIGSSMGGWIALLLTQILAAKYPLQPPTIAGLVLIAPAVDFTEELMWKTFSSPVRNQIMEKGAFLRPSEYSDDPYVITRALIEDGRKNLLFGAPIETGCPVHILQGVQDTDVPWDHAFRLVSSLAQDDVVLTLIKDGDHRLSRDEDIEKLVNIVADLVNRIDY